MPTDLRYPIGPDVVPAATTASERAARVAAIASLPGELRAAVAGLGDAQLDTPYRPGGWTVRQVVHHVADSHANAYIRFKLALTEDDPTIKPYDENRWAALADTALPIEVSLRLVDSLHERWATVLRSVAAADFARTYQHPERGPQTLDVALASYVWHGRHHTAHITALRAREGW
jgi:uncharacterized damage-inducible protein DinB